MALDLSGKYFNLRADGMTYSYYAYTSAQGGTKYLAFSRDGVTRYLPFTTDGNGRLGICLNNTPYRLKIPSANIVVSYQITYFSSLVKSYTAQISVSSDYGFTKDFSISATLTVPNSGSGSVTGTASLPANSTSSEKVAIGSLFGQNAFSWTLSITVSYDGGSSTQTASGGAQSSSGSKTWTYS